MISSSDSQSAAVAGYRPPAGAFDEVKAGSDEVRPVCRGIMAAIDRLGPEGLNDRREHAHQLLQEHGVTYNVYADGRSAERPWNLDMLPLLIGAEEWAVLEAGLVQRTRLLNLVLADIYGPQRLLQEGLLPPALLHANPGFLRPCHGVRPPGDQHLTLHAVDITRAPDGQWWVLMDRTQAPSGVGYTVENRVVLSRVLGEEFRTHQVQRLASFFLRRKEGLRALAPWTDSPNIVLLTPGPLNETYFEHAYLARYLGYALVEGNDLTVRDRRVYLKTIEGLQPVDVIIRRVDDTFCDPLELRSDSFLGVPGLVEAARAGNVAISNALGSGAVEAPALLAFLPALARHLLGEDLLIPNVATWWCGQKREREYTLSRLGRLVVKRAFVGNEIIPQFTETMEDAGRAEIAARIRANPHAFVGQERVPLSTAPVWTGSRLEPRPMLLRCYICATPNGYMVMPGGLTRVSASADSPIVTSRFGGGSKDTWILSERPVEEVSLLDNRGRPTRVERNVSQTPSRVVENFFWLGRYAERLEDSTRLLRTVLSRLAGETGPVEAAERAAMTRTMIGREKLPEGFCEDAPFEEMAEELRALIFDEQRVGSIHELLRRIAYLTASVRDRLSGDTWRILNHLQTEFPEPIPNISIHSMLGILHRLVIQLAAFSGMGMENTTRGHAWRFLDIGRRLERADNLMSTLQVILEKDARNPAALVPLLEYSDSTMTYRRRYLATPELPQVLEVLLGDATNPRALAFQIDVLRHHFVELPEHQREHPEAVKFAEQHAIFSGASFFALGVAAGKGQPQPLEHLLERLLAGCRETSDLLTAHYFSHVLARPN